MDFDLICVGVNKIGLLSLVVNSLVNIVWEKEKYEDL